MTRNFNVCFGCRIKVNLNVENGPDHLLHGGGPAHVHGLAEALGGPGFAGGADEMTIATGKYLERRLHGLKADRAGG